MVSVFVEIQLKSVCLCCGLIVGEVFKLLEEEGVSLSELESAPLDSLYVAPAMSGAVSLSSIGVLLTLGSEVSWWAAEGTRRGQALSSPLFSASASFWLVLHLPCGMCWCPEVVEFTRQPVDNWLMVIRADPNFIQV